MDCARPSSARESALHVRLEGPRGSERSEYLAHSPERGITLVELLVVLAVLGAMATVVGLAWRRGDWDAARPAGGIVVVDQARRRALDTGTPVAVRVKVDDMTVQVMALPDGRIVGADRFGYDPLSGRLATPASGSR